MWIDGMILLPLIVLGIEQLVHNGKGALYTGALAVLLLSNYYMGYMACIFSVLYFLAYFLMTAKPRPEKSGEKAHHSGEVQRQKPHASPVPQSVRALCRVLFAGRRAVRCDPATHLFPAARQLRYLRQLPHHF